MSDGKRRKAAATAPPDDADELLAKLTEREFICASLKDKLSLAEARRGELEKGAWNLGTQLAQQAEDATDTATYLRGELQVRNAHIESLEAQLAQLRKEHAQATQAASKASEQAAAATQAAQQAQAAALARVQDKLAEAEHFLAERDQLLEQTQTLREQADAEKRDYHRRQMALERKHAQDRDLWKKDTEKAVHQAREEMVALTDERLDSTIKRTIVDNESMSQELVWQSRQTQRLIARNQELEQQVVQLQVELSVAVQGQEALAAKNHACQRTIETLLARVEVLEVQRGEDATALLEGRTEAEQLQQEISSAVVALADREDCIAKLKQQLRAKKNECSEIKAGYDDAAAFLAACITDARQALLAADPAGQAQRTPADAADRPDTSLSIASCERPGLALHELPLAQREEVLRSLLQRLHVEWGDREGLILPSSSSAAVFASASVSSIAAAKPQPPSQQ